MSSPLWIGIFFITFCIMEFNSWFLHKYVMHGFLWGLHKDHHIPNKNRRWQFNDTFAFFFATPSFLFILFDHLYTYPFLGAIGFGIMAYGVVYFFIHEVLIHHRLKFLSYKDNWYFEAINAAHKAHHSVKTKNGAYNFGMLIVPIKYFKFTWKKHRKMKLAKKTKQVIFREFS